MYWIELIIGLLILISPWALGLGDTVMVWTNGAFGAVLILMSAWYIFVSRRNGDTGIKKQ